VIKPHAQNQAVARVNELRDLLNRANRAYYADNGEDAFLFFADLVYEVDSGGKESPPSRHSK
jgi:hypothetical protein